VKRTIGWSKETGVQRRQRAIAKCNLKTFLTVHRAATDNNPSERHGAAKRVQTDAMLRRGEANGKERFCKHNGIRVGEGTGMLAERENRGRKSIGGELRVVGCFRFF